MKEEKRKGIGISLSKKVNRNITKETRRAKQEKKITRKKIKSHEKTRHK